MEVKPKVIYYTLNPEQSPALVYRVRATILNDSLFNEQFLIVHPDTLKLMQERRPDIEWRPAERQKDDLL